jgi:hypothetical protein
MDILPIDLTALVAVIMGTSIVLIPVAGLTARFALKPLVESLSKGWEHKGLEDTVAVSERRIAFLEQQVESMEGTVRHLEEAQNFDRQLRAGEAPESPARPGNR